MRLSTEEMARYAAMYERHQLWRKYGGAAAPFVGIPAGMGGLIASLMHEIRRSGAEHHLRELCMLAGVFGLLIGASAVWSILMGRERKRNLETLEFVEKHFPDDCSWLQEKRILQQAEELQREARAANLVATAIQHREA